MGNIKYVTAFGDFFIGGEERFQVEYNATSVTPDESGLIVLFFVIFYFVFYPPIDKFHY
jgi:hypothetical protein